MIVMTFVCPKSNVAPLSSRENCVVARRSERSVHPVVCSSPLPAFIYLIYLVCNLAVLIRCPPIHSQLLLEGLNERVNEQSRHNADFIPYVTLAGLLRHCYNDTFRMKSRSLVEIVSASLCICIFQIALDHVMLIKAIASCTVCAKSQLRYDCRKFAISSRIPCEILRELQVAATEHEQFQNWHFLLFLAF